MKKSIKLSKSSKIDKTKTKTKNIKLLLFFVVAVSLIYVFSQNQNYSNPNPNLEEGFSNEYKDYKDSSNINSILTQEDSNSEKKEEINYLYWTGGYDSTFRLIEMLVDENKVVQPIYVALVLDNDCQTEESCTKLWLRRNRKEEYTAMESIVAKIKEKYPHLEERLLKTIIVDEHITDDTFNFNYEKLFYSKNLWPKKRKTHQYLFLSKYAYYHKKAIDIGVLGIHEKSLLAKFLKKKLVKTDDNFIIKIKNHPLTYLRFPLFGRTKEILLEKAQVNGYDDILKLTWSCWFPKDGKPCEKCPMCKERIVEHPDNKT